MKKLSVLLVAVSLMGCSHGRGIPKFERDETLSTMNDESKPDWANEGKPFFVKNSMVYSVGVASIRGDERPEAGVRIASSNARANVARAISTRAEYILQVAEEGTAYDGNVAKYIGSEISRITTNQQRDEATWWVRYAQSDENGDRKIRYKIYSLIAMPEDDFKKAMNRTMGDAVAQKKLSPTFQSQVNRQWDRFIEGETTAPRAPSSAAAPVDQTDAE